MIQNCCGCSLIRSNTPQIMSQDGATDSSDLITEKIFSSVSFLINHLPTITCSSDGNHLVQALSQDMLEITDWETVVRLLYCWKTDFRNPTILWSGDNKPILSLQAYTRYFPEIWYQPKQLFFAGKKSICLQWYMILWNLPCMISCIVLYWTLEVDYPKISWTW